MKPEHAHPHAPKHDDKPQKLIGIYRQPIYSPKGGLEGLLLDIDGKPAQIVLDPHQDAAVFAGVTVGQRLQLDAAPSKPSPKGEAAHAVFEFRALRSVDGRERPAGDRQPTRFSGKVIRLNYAKHGEPTAWCSTAATSSICGRRASATRVWRSAMPSRPRARRRRWRPAGA